MIQAVETYLAMRRAAGFDLLNADYLLHSFARFAADHHETHARIATAIEWAALSTMPAQRDERLKTVCRFVRYIRAEDDRHELPPSGYFGCHKTRRTPRIYSNAEIRLLMDAALQLKPPDSLRPHSYETLIGLLAATGLRVSEALGIEFSDITTDGLLIRKTKFQKTRLVPLHETVRLAVDKYVTCRRRMHSNGQRVFIRDGGRPLPYWEVHATFLKLLKMSDLLSSGRRLRLHELRHTFAVRALETSPAGRQRVGQHMLALATYLGHANIYDTYWYLETTPELLRDIAAAGEAFYCGGQP